MVDGIVLHFFEREFALGNLGEFFHPAGNVQMGDGDVYGQGGLRKGTWKRGDYSRIIAPIGTEVTVAHETKEWQNEVLSRLRGARRGGALRRFLRKS